MIILDDFLISEDLLDRSFCCNIAACMGACCVQGDSGAPLTEEEVSMMKKELPAVWSLLSEEAQRMIQQAGFWEMDKDGSPATRCLPSGHCVFVHTDEKGIAHCAWQLANNHGNTPFIKPISCHLYPVRIKKLGDYTALNMHQWSVCKPAEKMGESLGLPAYVFLKDSLQRAFGEDWYRELSALAEARKMQ